jgi:hypothetical protein
VKHLLAVFVLIGLPGLAVAQNLAGLRFPHHDRVKKLNVELSPEVLASEVILDGVLLNYSAPFRYCYERVLRYEPIDNAALDFETSVSPNGNLNAKLVTTDVSQHLKELGTCVAGRMSVLTAPRVSSGNYLIHFVFRQSD